MTDHFARPRRAASSERVAELHRLADADYAKGRRERATALPFPSYTSFAVAAAVPPATEPSDLDVAIRVAQQMLDSDQVPSLREALRLLLRALGAEPQPTETVDPGERCPAAHPDDPTPCDGPIAVTILDAKNSGANGCEHHGARLLASLEGGRVYPLPDAPDGAAIRVFKAADTIRPFPWLTDAPRTQPSQLSRAENRAGGEQQ